MIDSVALPVIGQKGVCGWELDTVAARLLRCRLGLQMPSAAHDGSSRILDTLASLSYSGGKWQHVVYLSCTVIGFNIFPPKCCT